MDPRIPIWFLGDGVSFWGPYSLLDLQQWVIPPNMLVWAPGWPQWVPFGQVFPPTGPIPPFPVDPTFSGRGWPKGPPPNPPGRLMFSGRQWPRPPGK